MDAVGRTGMTRSQNMWSIRLARQLILSVDMADTA
jgi:hypothetical protein